MLGSGPSSIVIATAPAAAAAPGKCVQLGPNSLLRGHKPAATIQYNLLKNNQSVLEVQEDVAKLPEASANQTILEKTMSLASLDPGKYTMKITVTDTVGKKTIAPSADFVLR